MWIIISVAAGAALAVIVYNKVRERDPELANASMRRVHQLAAVIVVITSGIEKTFDALQVGKPKPVYSAYGPSSARSPWLDEDDDFDDVRGRR